MIEYSNAKPKRPGVYGWKKDARAQKYREAVVLRLDAETLSVEIRGTRLAGALDAFPATHLWSTEPLIEIREE